MVTGVSEFGEECVRMRPFTDILRDALARMGTPVEGAASMMDLLLACERVVGKPTVGAAPTISDRVSRIAKDASYLLRGERWA